MREICQAGLVVFELTDAAWSGPRSVGSVAFDVPGHAGLASAVTAVSLWFDERRGAGGGEWRLVQTSVLDTSHDAPQRSARDIARSGLRFAVGRDDALSAMEMVSRAGVPAPAGTRTAADIVESTMQVDVDGEAVEFAVARHDAYVGLGARLTDHSIRIAGRGDPQIALRIVRSFEPYSAA